MFLQDPPSVQGSQKGGASIEVTMATYEVTMVTKTPPSGGLRGEKFPAPLFFSFSEQKINKITPAFVFFFQGKKKTNFLQVHRKRKKKKKKKQILIKNPRKGSH